MSIERIETRGRLRGFEDLSTNAVIATIFVCLSLPVIHWLALWPEVPQITFVQLSYLPPLNEITDPSDFLYSFLRPPVHELLDWAYKLPAAFVLVGLATHGTLNLLVFALAYRGLKRIDLSTGPVAPWMVAILVVVWVYPLGLVLGLTGHGTTLVPHDAYHTFSFRTFFWILALASYILILERRLGAALLVMAFGCYMHPSAGVVGFGLVSLVVLWRLRHGIDRRLVATWIVAGLIGAAPNMVRFVAVEMPPELIGAMSHGAWYSQLIKDEADDFSILFQFAHRSGRVFVIFATLGVTLGLYAWLVPNYRRHLSFWAALAVPVLYLLAALVEYVFAVLHPTFLIYPISALTIGYRLLSYAFPPFIVLGARIAAALLQRAWTLAPQSRSVRALSDERTPVVAAGLLVVTAYSAFLALGASTGALGASLAYAEWALRSGPVPGIDAYFVAARQAGKGRYQQPPVFEVSDGFKTYPGVRNIFTIARMDREQPARTQDTEYDRARTLASFVEVVEAVRRAIPEGEGLFIPPYQRHFRDALPRHPIFFQEHPDGNVMMVSSAFMKFWNERMVDLIGLTYEDMPSKESGLIYTAMRNAYLAVDSAKALELRDKYPSYRYFVTEKRHQLDFATVARTGAFVVYDLRKPAHPLARSG